MGASASVRERLELERIEALASELPPDYWPRFVHDLAESARTGDPWAADRSTTGLRIGVAGAATKRGKLARMASLLRELLLEAEPVR
jgi:hypothetical protein